MKNFILLFSFIIFSLSSYCQQKPHASQRKIPNNKILLLEKIVNPDEQQQIVRINIGQHITVKYNSKEKPTASGVLRDITDSTITVDKKIIYLKDITKIIHSNGKMLIVTGVMLFTAATMIVIAGALDSEFAILILLSGAAGVGSFIIGMHLELKHGQFDIPQTWKLSISDKMKEKQKQLEKHKNKNPNYH
jgi:hypothetical protein